MSENWKGSCLMSQRISLLITFVCAFMLPFANIPVPPTAGVALAAQLARKGHSNGVTSLVFSPDGSLLASVGRDSVIRLSDVATAQELRVLQGHEEPIRSVAFSP